MAESVTGADERRYTVAEGGGADETPPAWSPVWALAPGGITASVAVIIFAAMRNSHPDGLYTNAGEVHTKYRAAWEQCEAYYEVDVCIANIKVDYYPWYLEHDLWVALGLGVMTTIIALLGMIVTAREPAP